MISMVVAFDEGRGIGYKGKIPWGLPEDMKHFREATIGHAIIMGRLTWESIGRPLPHRRNIVVSRTIPFLRGAEVVPGIEEAIVLTGNDAIVIGGQKIYELALPFTQRIFASQVRGVHLADTFFPVLNPNVWTGTIIRSYTAFDLWKYEREQSDDFQRI